MSEKVYKKECVVKLPKGIHARPSGIIVKIVNNQSVFIERKDNGQVAEANQILSLLTLGVNSNDEVIVYTDKDDLESKSKVDEVMNFISSENEEFLD